MGWLVPGLSLDLVFFAGASSWISLLIGSLSISPSLSMSGRRLPIGCTSADDPEGLHAMSFGLGGELKP